MVDFIKNWDGEMIVTHFDHPTNSWIFIAVHSTTLGPATGGTRMMYYNSPTDALTDCLKLSKGMTLKFALANFPRGGGKAVIAIPKDISNEMRKALLLRYGKLIKKLNGLFYTGPDIGTSSEDMDIIAETATDFVFSKTKEKGGAGDSSEATAYGVFCAIKATIEYMEKKSSLKDKTILLQGVGNVGAKLMYLLLSEGAIIYYNDINENIMSQLSVKNKTFFVKNEEIYKTNCDIFSPCALGGILNRQTIQSLRCRAIVGAANNQLAESEIANMLKARNILYAPDFAVNIGGAMAITGIEAMNWSAEQAKSEIEKIGTTVKKIYKLSDKENISTEEAARRLAYMNL